MVDLAISAMQPLYLLLLIHVFSLYFPGTTDSLCKSARRAPACGDLVLDPPPGFPLDVPPGFTRAHCGLRRGKTAESHIDSSPSLAFDTPGLRLDAPPGFTKAHGGLHTNDSSMPSPGSENGASTLFSEKKSPIKFSLNITRPPGFAKLAEVKKEPGLPAFFKATEKTPPIGKANEKDIKHDKVQHYPCLCFSNPIFSSGLYFSVPWLVRSPVIYLFWISGSPCMLCLCINYFNSMYARTSDKKKLLYPLRF